MEALMVFWIVLSLSLLCAVASATVTPGTLNSDAYAETTSFTTGTTALHVGYEDVTYDCCSYVRFTLDVPQGATVSSATLTLILADSWDMDFNISVDAEDVDSSQALTGDPTGWTYTTAQTSAFTQTGVAGDSFGIFVSAVIQEIVNRPGWSSGNYITLRVLPVNHVKADPLFKFAADEHATYAPAVLSVTHTGGVSSRTPRGSGTAGVMVF